MRQILKNFIAVVFLLVVLLPATSSPTKAQEAAEENFGIAYPVDILHPDDIPIENGMIVSHKNGSYQLSDEAYDRSIIGAVSLFPAIEFVGNTTATNGDEIPIISFGVSPVLVSGESGPIVKGDFITASSEPGVGMKATKSGFTLGIAQEDFNGSTAQDKNLIKVQIGKDFTFAQDTPDSETISDRLRDIVSLSAIAAIDDPKEVLKYVVAGVILITAVTIAFISFSRTSQKGIEALGRNPLARSSIMTGIFVNILISITIIGAGIAGSYFVVTL
ncbi:MAG: hypothetical protein BroJett025_00150 [Patescibacteria group bacterium]|nr:MAG: hypothetical protein BroJett025_00150 [Patescibacteria group bacterium]